MLSALANNGGPTETMALESGSPAIMGGDPLAIDPFGNFLTTDQRGSVRPGNDDSLPDIGAYDITLPVTHLVVVAPGTVMAGQAFSFTVIAEDSNDNPDPGYFGTAYFTSTDRQAVQGKRTQSSRKSRRLCSRKS
jgi:hypothetical protein